jgi:hypothetical protein
MHGLGDVIYSRAVIRQYLQRYSEIWLETPWPSIWHDIPQLHLVNPRTNLRTQAKNVARAGVEFEVPPINIERKRLWYFSSEIREGKWNSLPNAMLGNMGCSIPGDYRLPVPLSWRNGARALLPPIDKPLLIYRPLTFRPEWKASGARNPEPEAYVNILSAVRDQFFVVSIADVEDGKEWFVGPQIKADLEFHRGELAVEEIAGMFAIADLVYAAPGFALALAQAVETPSIIIFGGHESSRAYRASATFAAALMIDPINPCDCFNDQHRCDKRIDVPDAKRLVEEFCEIQTAHSVLKSTGHASQRDSLGGGDVLEYSPMG